MKLLAPGIVLAAAASVVAAPDIEKRPITIQERPHRVGDRHRVRVENKTFAEWNDKASGAGHSTSRGGASEYTLTVTAVDAKQRVQRVLVQMTQARGGAQEWRVVRGRTKAPGYWLAKQLLQRRSVANLYGLKGSFKPGGEVKLRKAMWDELILNGVVSEQDVRYLGVEKGTGLAILRLRYLVTETDVNFKGCTVRSLWEGTIAFDPVGPRLRRVSLDAEVEVFLPPGKPGQARGTGKMRWRREVTRAKAPPLKPASKPTRSKPTRPKPTSKPTKRRFF